MKKFTCTLLSLLMVLVTCIFTACSNDTISGKSEVSKEDDITSSIQDESLSSEISSLDSSKISESESKTSVEEKSDNNTSSNVVSEEASLESITSEEISDEPEESSEQQSQDIDLTQKYPKPQIDESSIAKDITISCVSDGFDLRDYTDYIMENFNEKIYEPGITIDVKSTLSSQQNPEEYYKVYSLLYTRWNFSSVKRTFEEIDAYYEQSLDQKYIIDNTHNLVLKYSKDYVSKIYIYFENESLHILVTKV